MRANLIAVESHLGNPLMWPQNPLTKWQHQPKRHLLNDDAHA